MTNTKLYLPFYYEWADALMTLEDEDFGRLFRAIIKFAEEGVESEDIENLSPEAQMAYGFLASTIVRSEKRRLAGQKGGLARAKNARERKKGVPKTKYDKNKGNSPTKIKNKANNVKKEEENFEKTEKFTTPTLDEVRKFFCDSKFSSNPDEFFNFYESNGWLVGKNPMKNWKSSAENWEIKAQRPTKCGNNMQEVGNFPHYEKNSREKEVAEAFRLAMERSYGPNADDDEE